MKPKNYHTLPKGLQNIYDTCDKAICKLIVEEGLTPNKAEDLVLELLKENESSLVKGDYSVVNLCLQHTFELENMSNILNQLL